MTEHKPIKGEKVVFDLKNNQVIHFETPEELEEWRQMEEQDLPLMADVQPLETDNTMFDDNFFENLATQAESITQERESTKSEFFIDFENKNGGLSPFQSFIRQNRDKISEELRQCGIKNGWEQSESSPLNPDSIEIQQAKQDQPTLEECWDGLVERYFEEYGLIRNQIDSYNYFVQTIIPQLFVNQPPIEIRPSDNCKKASHKGTIHRIRIENVHISQPKVNEEQKNKIRQSSRTAALKNASSNITYLTPAECRLRGLTYSAEFLVDFLYEIERPEAGTIEKKRYRVASSKQLFRYSKIKMGEFPIMVRSCLCILSQPSMLSVEDLNECALDFGGSYVINGNEKVLIAQEKMRSNFPLVLNKTTIPGKLVFETEIRSSIELSLKPTSVVVLKYKLIKGKASPILRISLPYNQQHKKDIPVSIFFRALGVVSDEDIIFHIWNEIDQQPELLSHIKTSLEEGAHVTTQEEALEYIGRRGLASSIANIDVRIDTNVSIEEQQKMIQEKLNQRQRCIKYTRELVNRDIFPHIGTTSDSLVAKGYFLGYMCRKTILVAIGVEEPDSKDFYAQKRVDLVASLMGSLLGQYLVSSGKDAKVILQKQIDEGKNINLSLAFKAKTITQNFKYSFSTGSWGSKRGKGAKKNGVTSIHARLSYGSTLSHLRRLSTPIGREGKMIKPRHQQGSTWCMICPSETPEGQSCGLVKNFALMTTVSTGDHSIHFMDLLDHYGLVRFENLERRHFTTWHQVHVNGAWLGMVEDHETMFRNMKLLKRTGIINPETKVCKDDKRRFIRVDTDAGRVLRPVLVVENGKLLLTRERLLDLIHGTHFEDSFSKLAYEGCIEYVDVEEEDHALIALFPSDLIDHPHKKYDYCEIHPASIFGVCAQSIPFAPHNPPARNTYQSAMLKQAVSICCYSILQRFDTMSHLLYYPQKALVSTKGMKTLHYQELPFGQNLIALIMNLLNNQEDALICNRTFIELGGLRSVMYKTIRDEQKKRGTAYVEKFEKPDPKTCYDRRQDSSYDKVEEDGLVAPGTRIDTLDIVIAKTGFLNSVGNKEAKKKDLSSPNRADEGVVDKVMISTTSEGINFAKVCIRSVRIPQLGDKVTSRHGQKGLFGQIVNREDLPFDPQTGMSPDIILNSHAKVSRMTNGHTFETLYGLVCANYGIEGDATAFERGRDIEILKDKLFEYGRRPEDKKDIGNPLLSHTKGRHKHQRDGQVVLYCGKTGKRLKEVGFMGPCYYQKLKHFVCDKIHARDRGPLTLVCRQPVEGRARDGGLRFGEMERDCFVGYGIALQLNASLMHNSDASEGIVCEQCGDLGFSNSRTKLVRGSKINTDKPLAECKRCGNTYRFQKVAIPHSLKVLFTELKAMHINPKIMLQDISGNS